MRKNSNKKFDKDGYLSFSGKSNKIIYEQAQELYMNSINEKKFSYDVNDFDVSFVRGLTLEDGAATLTDFTASIISKEILISLENCKEKVQDILVCGGGRKNKYFIQKIKENLPININLKLVDDYKIDGDFIESQAFAYLAIRAILKLPISFPGTTLCNTPSAGGELIEN